MSDVGSTVNLADLVARLVAPDAVAAYRPADPFPHLVIDGALEPAVFARAAAEFPPPDAPLWNRYLQVNQAKYARTDVDSWGPTLRALARGFASTEFVKALEQLSGLAGLVADPGMDGGGLHQTLRGGHLNVHCDFTTHHTEPGWHRRVNVLLYLNEQWSSGWGGDLEMWDRGMRNVVRSVAPSPNRLLIFSTSSVSFHGHPEPLRCPENVARRSLALYYFTVEDRPVARATDYRARPGDGLRAVPIWLDARLLRGYDLLKRRSGLSDSDRYVHALTGRLGRVRQRSRRSGDKGPGR